MILWWIMNVVGLLVVIPVVLFLAVNLLRLGHEVLRYANDIREHGLGLATALEPVAALVETRDAAAVIEDRATAYLAALQPKLGKG